jgi:hypothetical protein
MSTAVAPYSPPSRTELANEIRQYAPAMYLYHACPEWLEMQIFGRSFWVPPHQEGEPLIEHPQARARGAHGEDLGPAMVKADGRLPVKDIYGILRDKKMLNRPIGVGLLEGQDAGSVVMFAVENYGERGIVWLRGDESDASRKTASRKLYIRFIRAWAEGERNARSEFLRRWQENKDNKGRVPPPPTPTQIRGQEILDTIATETRTGAEFICTVAYDWEGSTFEKYARHMKAAHGKIVTPPKDDGVEARPQGRGLSVNELEALENPTELEEGTPIAASGRGTRLPAMDPTSPAANRRRGPKPKPTKR